MDTTFQAVHTSKQLCVMCSMIGMTNVEILYGGLLLECVNETVLVMCVA